MRCHVIIHLVNFFVGVSVTFYTILGPSPLRNSDISDVIVIFQTAAILLFHLHAPSHTENPVCLAATFSSFDFHYTINLSSNVCQYRAAKGTASFSNCFIKWFTMPMSPSLLAYIAIPGPET